MLLHLLLFENQSNSKVLSITLKFCLHFVQKARRFCVSPEICSEFWNKKHHLIKLSIQNWSALGSVKMYISFMIIQVFPKLLKVVKWLTLLMIVSRFAVNFPWSCLFKFNMFFLFCVKFDFPDQKVHTLVCAKLCQWFFFGWTLCNLTDFFLS